MPYNKAVRPRFALYWINAQRHNTAASSPGAIRVEKTIVAWFMLERGQT